MLGGREQQKVSSKAIDWSVGGIYSSSVEPELKVGAVVITCPFAKVP